MSNLSKYTHTNPYRGEEYERYQVIIMEQTGNVTLEVCRVYDNTPDEVIVKTNNLIALLEAGKNATELLSNLTRILDRITENGLQEDFPSAFYRAFELVKRLTP